MIGINDILFLEKVYNRRGKIMITVGVLCIVVAAISALKARESAENAWQKYLAIIFLVLGIILLGVGFFHH